MSVKRTGLGRNLSALLNSHAVITAATADAIHSTLVNITSLQPGHYQPRSAMDDLSLSELATSIQNQGLLQPLVVREIDINRYEIIAGERRFRACQRIGMTEIPVMVRKVDNETALAIALVENLQRESLNVMDCARAMEQLIKEFGLTHQQIAQLLCKSRASVSNHLRLLQLHPDVCQMVERGDLEMGHARSLLSLEREQQLVLALKVVDQQLSVRATELLVARAKMQPEIVAADTKPIVSPQMLQDMQILSQRLQTMIKLKPGKAGAGALMIHYATPQALESLFLQLNAVIETA